MQPVIYAMKGGCQYNSNIGYKNNTTEQGIERRKDLSLNSMDLYNRAHAT